MSLQDNQKVPEKFIGRWQSDARKTLECLKNTPHIPDKTRSFFQNNFFGRLVLIIETDKSASYFPEDLENEKSAPFDKNEIKESGENHVTFINYFEPFPDHKYERTFYYEDGYICCDVETKNGKFKEYFQRISE